MAEEQLAKLGGQLDDLGFDPYDIDAVQAAIRSVLRESKPASEADKITQREIDSLAGLISRLERESVEKGGAKG
jgi:hypothetical protein